MAKKIRVSFGVFLSIAAAPFVVLAARSSRRAPELVKAAALATVSGIISGFVALYAAMWLIAPRGGLEAVLIFALFGLPPLMSLVEGYTAAWAVAPPERRRRCAAYGFGGALVSHALWWSLLEALKPKGPGQLVPIVLCSVALFAGSGAAVAAALGARRAP
jgi:hypothetical protein